MGRLLKPVISAVSVVCQYMNHHFLLKVTKSYSVTFLLSNFSTASVIFEVEKSSAASSTFKMGFVPV